MDPQDPDAAIVSLLTQHQSALHLYVQSLMPGDPSSEDVAQETNAKIWEKRGGFEIGTHFKAWAFSIARFQVRKYRFEQAKNSRLVFCEELEDVIAAEIPRELDDLSEHQLALRSCLQKLKPAERALIHHRYFKRAPLKDYSIQVGRSIGSLKVTLHRLRNRLQICIEKRVSQTKEVQA